MSTPCWRSTRGISRATARCAAWSSACAAIGGAGRSSAGRPRRRDCPSRSFPNTPPGARKGRRFWRPQPGSGPTARRHAASRPTTSMPCRERAPAWRRPSRRSNARGSSTMPDGSSGRGTGFANGLRRAASRSCMRRATGRWRSWAKARGRRGARCPCAARGGGMAGGRSGAGGAGGRGAHPARPHRGVAGAPGGPAAGRARRARSGASRTPHLARGRHRTLEAAAGDMLRPEDVHAPYLDVEPGQRAAIGQAVEEVGGAATRPVSNVRVADDGGGPAGARRPDRSFPCAALRRDGRGGAGALRAGGAAGAHAGSSSPRGSTTMPGANGSAGRSGTGPNGRTRWRRNAPSVPRRSTPCAHGGSGRSPCSPRPAGCWRRTAPTRPTWPPCRTSARRWSRQGAASSGSCVRSRRGRPSCCPRSRNARWTSSTGTGRRTSPRPRLPTPIPST